MTRVITGANIAGADDFYAELLGLHVGRSKLESDAINARLILLLANHIGDRDVLREAMQMAAAAGQPRNARDGEIPD